MPAVQPLHSKGSSFARIIENNKVSVLLPFHWLSLAIKDFLHAPVISLLYGLVFSIIPIGIFYAVDLAQNHLIILPASIAFALIGPAFAAGLYDVAWELEKGHRPTVLHSLKAMFRNPVGEWGLAVVLMIAMVAWTRIAALLHALYPSTINPSFNELVPFLTIGTIVGALLTAAVFCISAFTPQIMVERRIDVMTAIATSVKAVIDNLSAMLVWAAIILTLVAIGFVTKGYGFLVLMPILSFASWHGYIAVIKTKRPRKYE